MSVPNQIIITQFKYEDTNKDNLYAKINLDAMSKAIAELTGKGLALWLYLSKNNANKIKNYELSQVACTKFGIKKSSYYNAKEELEAKGYLRPVQNEKNKYEFVQWGYTEDEKKEQYAKMF